jgi:ATP-dependent Clp protease ATP-binding subunit ClpA
MFDHASQAVRATISQAANEAALRGDRRIGTDHLLLGLLHDRDAARAIGVDLEQAQAVARQLDRAALEAIGIDPGETPLAHKPAGTRHTPPTSAMRATMARAFTIAREEHAREVEPRHLRQALLELEPPDPAAALLQALGISQNSTASNAAPPKARPATTPRRSQPRLG